MEILEGVPDIDTEQHLKKAVTNMTPITLDPDRTIEEKEGDPKFVEAESDLDEAAVLEQEEFMDNLDATNSKNVGDKSDDSDDKAQLMSSGADFGAELRLSEAYPEESPVRDLMKTDPAFDSIVRSLFEPD